MARRSGRIYKPMAFLNLEEMNKRCLVFVDTHIFTLFRFLDMSEDGKPYIDEFIPPGEEAAVFVITMPILRELERIKDEHWNSKQQERARRTISKLDADNIGGYAVVITERSALSLRMAEARGIARTSDDEFIACVREMGMTMAKRSYVLSNDVGVRVRARQIVGLKDVLIPPETLRHAQEEYSLPQVIKALVKELAREVAAEVREVESTPKQVS